MIPNANQTLMESLYMHIYMSFPGGSDGKEFNCNMKDSGLIPGPGIYSGEGNGNPLHYSCLENSYGQRSLAGYSPWSHKQSHTTECLTPHLYTHTHTHTHTHIYLFIYLFIYILIYTYEQSYQKTLDSFPRLKAVMIINIPFL